MIEVEDVDKTNISDVFQVCSPNLLNDPAIQNGSKLKREWIRENLGKYGPFTKIAYKNNEPVAQIMFFPEIAVPYYTEPRPRVIEIICAYRVKPEAQGAGTLLLKTLIEEARHGIKCLNYEQCDFLVASPFNTGEGTSLRKYYLDNGFKEAEKEYYLELNGLYYPRPLSEYNESEKDIGKAIIFYDMNCEYSWRTAVNIEKIISDIDESLEINKINRWINPQESIKRGNSLVSVNGKPIKHYWNTPEFKQEVKQAIS
jgi:GNAT superfamily N-acetyltransferase